MEICEKSARTICKNNMSKCKIELKAVVHPTVICLIKNKKDDTTMTRQERIAQFEKMLRRAPEIMSPMKVARFSPFGKNKVYELIKTKQLKAYVYQNAYIVAKIDLIEYLADHCEERGLRSFGIQK